MKYLLAGLLFWVTALPTRAMAPTPPVFRISATASFATTDPTGTTTAVVIKVHDASPFTQVTVWVQRTRNVCTGSGCQLVPVLDAVTVQLVPARDAFIARHRRSGFVHDRFRLRDDVTQRALDVQVDVVWSSTALPVCVPGDDGAACDRAAVVFADVASGAERFVANQAIPDGQISWATPGV